MNRCKICGRPSGIYPLCKDCYQEEYGYYEDDYEDENDYDEDYYEDDYGYEEDYYDPTDTEYKNIKSLYTFDSIDHFNDYIQNLYNVENWTIASIPDKDRIEILSNKEYFQRIIEDFKSSKISPYHYKKTEILSYLDTLSLMHKIVNNIENEDFERNAKIIMEYVPNNYQGQDRCDYIITYRNLLIIFEFGRCIDRCNIKKRRTEKEQQLAKYEELIQNIVDKEIEIKTKAFIYQPEANENAEEENEIEINNTIKQIKKWLKSYHDAIDSLNEE